MIGWLRGRVRDVALEAGLPGMLLVEVAGVGYEVAAPFDSSSRLEPDADGLCSLYVHTNVREDALELYGFPTLEERTAFRVLISISKVGPKLALAVLSAVSVGELAQVVARRDVARLVKVPGIGRKTAERMVLELEGKLAEGPAAPRAAGRGAGPPAADRGPQQPRSVLQDALERMGFRPAEAERACAAVEDYDRPMGELIREALALLAP